MTQEGRVVNEAVCSHDQQRWILIIGQKDSIVVEMDETQVMAGATCLLCLVRNLTTLSLFYKDELCNTGIATVREEAGDLDEP